VLQPHATDADFRLNALELELDAVDYLDGRLSHTYPQIVVVSRGRDTEPPPSILRVNTLFADISLTVRKYSGSDQLLGGVGLELKKQKNGFSMRELPLELFTSSDEGEAVHDAKIAIHALLDQWVVEMLIRYGHR
jgi:hypothetical protein